MPVKAKSTLISQSNTNLQYLLYQFFIAFQFTQCSFHNEEDESMLIYSTQLSRYSDWLQAGRSREWIPVGQDFPTIQTGPGAHPASCAMGTGSFPGVKYGRGVLVTTNPLLVPWSWKSRAIPLPTLWATSGPIMGTLCLYLLLAMFYSNALDHSYSQACVSWIFWYTHNTLISNLKYGHHPCLTRRFKILQEQLLRPALVSGKHINVNKVSIQL